MGLGLAPGLYLVATPIGHLADITLRALDVLRTVDLIYCEDTRVTSKLLKHYGITTKMQVYHDHSDQRAREHLVMQLGLGKSGALVSDAGSPLVNDPGYKLVQYVRELGFDVSVVPGACSVIAGWTLSGLPTDQCLFMGFMPVKQKAREALLLKVAALEATLVWMERAGRLVASLEAIHAVLGNRRVSVARELTKRHEEVMCAPVEEVVAHYQDKGVKGEVILMVEGAVIHEQWSQEMVDKAIEEALEYLKVKDAASLVATQCGWSKKQVYARALEIKDR